MRCSKCGGAYRQAALRTPGTPPLPKPTQRVAMNLGSGIIERRVA